jgi:hypothetical protein
MADGGGCSVGCAWMWAACAAWDVSGMWTADVAVDAAWGVRGMWTADGGRCGGCGMGCAWDLDGICGMGCDDGWCLMWRLCCGSMKIICDFNTLFYLVGNELVACHILPDGKWQSRRFGGVL